IVALLFTERAMRLYRYPLPKLSLLYRCISRLPGSYLRHEHLPATPANIVAEAELGLILGRRSTHGANAGPNGDLDHRLVEEQPPTATAALAAINRHLNH
ncbi:MAG: hypothetical protein HOV83_06040, partial [Catenulispora sp.]|nr:hypothetical protein [Catenulispora sp.]